MLLIQANKRFFYILLLMGGLFFLKNAYSESGFDQYQLPLTVNIINETEMPLYFNFDQVKPDSSDTSVSVTLENKSGGTVIQGNPEKGGTQVSIYSYVDGTQDSTNFTYPTYSYTVKNIVVEFADQNGELVGCQYYYTCTQPSLVHGEGNVIYNCSSLNVYGSAFGPPNNEWLKNVNCLYSYDTESNKGTITIKPYISSNKLTRGLR